LFTKIVKDKGVEASKQFYKNLMDQIPDDRTRRIIDILIDQQIVNNIQGNR
jgi:divalent metal cation (Fe/Co/Zn/Cd) transporter